MTNWPEPRTVADTNQPQVPHSASYGPRPTAQGVRGYRDLTDGEVALINRVKEFEEDVAHTWGLIERLNDADPRWLAIARTHLQEGFSALVRSIARPNDPFAAALANNQQDEAEQVIPARDPATYRNTP